MRTETQMYLARLSARKLGAIVVLLAVVCGAVLT